MSFEEWLRDNYDPYEIEVMAGVDNLETARELYEEELSEED